MSSRTPPRYVPTLTEVVTSGAELGPDSAVVLSQEQLIERVMRRVDLTLERRLREAVAAAVIEQTRAIGPLLREEIEALVRETVAQAFAQGAAAGRPAGQMTQVKDGARGWCRTGQFAGGSALTPAFPSGSGPEIAICSRPLSLKRYLNLFFTLEVSLCR